MAITITFLVKDAGSIPAGNPFESVVSFNPTPLRKESMADSKLQCRLESTGAIVRTRRTLNMVTVGGGEKVSHFFNERWFLVAVYNFNLW